MSQKTLLVVGGPTASGKTAAAIALAQHFGTEIVSADARQFYRQMSIGTAKPSPEELAAVPHHLVGHLDVWQSYHVGAFEQDALAILSRIFQTKDVAVAVGGSGLYLRTLCYGIDEIPAVPAQIRSHVEAVFRAKGLPFLLAELQQYDAVYYQQVDKANPARVKRAVEVIYATGKPYSAFRKNQLVARPFRSVWIGLSLPREELYCRINRRVELMMQQGLEQEARSLLPYRHYNALQTVGYTELFDYFDGKITLSQAVALIQQHTRNYAKRQLTWFRRENMQWFAPTDWRGIIDYAEQHCCFK
ncbi:MAG: tRNA (adenosine(37)-N6)-dimethylallyltransferase MiaA [Cytophagales bacterium]|nr:tRNA (adenosine(37)-N6)-dimethylallyltransferase MiaA [Bernardetiaceae bacterium]MDW8204441.1 tRNA (adenosine(37)-N6)-dimethylallyltransferase MiaA [Cytophagales bacterium]